MHLRGRGGADGPTKFLEIQGPGPDDNYTSPFQRGEAQPMPYLFSFAELNRLALTTITNVQRQLPTTIRNVHGAAAALLAPAPVGNAQRFPAAGRGRRVSCGKGGGARGQAYSGVHFPAVGRCALLLGAVHGRGPAFHGKSAPEQGPTPGGVWGGQAVVDSACGIRALAASAR